MKIKIKIDVYRLYIGTRSRAIGDPSEFVYQLSLEVVVAQESIAVLDTVLIPVSWYVVEKDVNGRIYIIAEQNFSGSGHRIAAIPPGTMAMCTLWLLPLKRP